MIPQISPDTYQPSHSMAGAANADTKQGSPQVFVIDTSNDHYGKGFGHAEVINAIIFEESGVRARTMDIPAIGDRRHSTGADEFKQVAGNLETIGKSARGRLDHVFVNISIGFSKEQADKNPQAWNALKHQLEAVIRRGAKVFVAAGNVNDPANYLGSVNGVITVGSTRPVTSDRKHLPYISDGDIDVRADPVVHFKRTKDGVSVGDTGVTDIKLPDNFQLDEAGTEGTSFASPRALARAIRTGSIPKDTNHARGPEYLEPKFPEFRL